MMIRVSVWRILWSVLHLLTLLRPWLCLCESAVMTFFVSDGVSIGVLLQIVSILQTYVDSCQGSCFSSLTASSLHVWYLREEFAFDSIFKSLACESTVVPHMFLWKFNSVYISVQAGNHVSSLSWILYGYTLRWHASIRKSVWLKAGVYSNLDASARAVFQHDS